MNVLVVVAALAATGLAAVRWLRVAQREHYLPGAATRFAMRWWRLGIANDLLWLVAVVGAGFSFTTPAAGLVPVAVVAVGPIGLGLRGRTAKLAWTRRLKTLAAVYAVVDFAILALAIALGVGTFVAVVEAVVTFVLVDLALAITKPIERSLGNKFVEQARARLASVDPTVVAITGSYGKTGTKGYIAHLVSGTRSVVPSPASYNNRNGLAIAINGNLASGTEVFIAEMGTYGRGEIAELCSWCPPDIAVITAIGPVHLERMKSEDNILPRQVRDHRAGIVVVLNTDDLRLDELAKRLASEGRKVVRCSANDASADVFIDPASVDAPPTNVACAVAVAPRARRPAQRHRPTAGLPAGRAQSPQRRNRRERSHRDRRHLQLEPGRRPCRAGGAGKARRRFFEAGRRHSRHGGAGPATVVGEPFVCGGCRCCRDPPRYRRAHQPSALEAGAAGSGMEVVTVRDP